MRPWDIHQEGCFERKQYHIESGLIQRRRRETDIFSKHKKRGAARPDART
jgi:hypothetical protein